MTHLTNSEVHVKTLERLEALRRLGYRVTPMWECQIREKAWNTPDLAKSLARAEKASRTWKTRHMRVRDGLKGREPRHCNWPETKSNWSTLQVGGPRQSEPW